MDSEMEIVERSSGYWIVDMSGVIDGPFEDRSYALASLSASEMNRKDGVTEQFANKMLDELREALKSGTASDPQYCLGLIELIENGEVTK